MILVGHQVQVKHVMKQNGLHFSPYERSLQRLEVDFCAIFQSAKNSIAGAREQSMIQGAIIVQAS